MPHSMPRKPSGIVGPLQTSSNSPIGSARNPNLFESSGTLLNSPSTVSHQPLQITMEINGNRYQKVVSALSNRIKNKLPCNSGYSLDVVEADEIVQEAIEALVDLPHDALAVIAWNLGNILDGLSKLADALGQPSLEILQSQLFVLKVLSVNMASRLVPVNRAQLPSSGPSSLLTPASPTVSAFQRRQVSSEHSGSLSSPIDIPPLDERCVRYILSIIVGFFRQTAASEATLMLPSKTSDITFREFETEVSAQPESETEVTAHSSALKSQPSSRSILSGKMSISSAVRIPATQTKYQKTHMSLVKSKAAVSAMIAEYAGRVIFNISVSNWNTVFERLRSKIRVLANRPEETSDLTDLQLLAHIVLDRHRLIQVLSELSSLLVNMAREALLAISMPLRAAIWNWIEYHPGEYNEAIRLRPRTEGAPERVFDLLYNKMKPGDERLIWPTLTALECMFSERLAIDHIKYGSAYKPSRKDLKFLDEMLRQANGSSKFSEVALASAIDLCRGASFATYNPNEEIPFRLLAVDIAHEIKSSLWSSTNRKLFWESQDEIDVVLYAGALVTVFRFLPVEDSVPLFAACMEPERSDAIKICAVRACLTLVQEAPSFPWQKSLEPLYDMLARRYRDVFKTSGNRRPELDRYGMMKRSATYPKAKRAVSEALVDRELLMLGILSLWRLDSAFQTRGATAADLEEWVSIAVKIWDAPVDNSVKVSTATCLCRLTVNTFRMSPSDPHFIRMTQLIKSSLPSTLLSVSVLLLRAREDVELQRMWVTLSLQVLDLYLVKFDVPHVKEIQIDPDRISAFIIAEIAFTVTLTSPNSTVSQMAARGLRNLSIAQRQTDAPQIDLVSREEFAKRARVYEQLGDPKVAVVGRIGHQKRIRKHLRLLAPFLEIQTVVWNECYKRWRLLTEPVLELMQESSQSARPNSGPNWKTQDMKFQWHHLTLFLAAFGGVCLEDVKAAKERLTSIIPLKYLPDEVLSMEDIHMHLHPFLSDLIKILTISDVVTRDIAREGLGAELHPRLYPKLLKYLDDTTRAYESEGINLSDEYLLFLDQFIAILKLILQNERFYLEEKMTFDISSILMSLTSMIARCVGSQTFRLRIKFCSLCDSISTRTETFALRKESPVRQNIVVLLIEWMEGSIHDAGQDNLVDDFNTACLKTLVKLLDRFQLRFTDTLNAGDDTIHVISREFNKFSQILLQFLGSYQSSYTADGSDSDEQYSDAEVSQREMEVRELVITGLANLVSANSEIGFKQCLSLAHDHDKRKREIFAHVFSRVIGQGTQFSAEERSVTQNRNARLFEMVRGSKFALALTIVQVCPFSEEDLMISVLLNMFDTRTSLIGFLKALIDNEIQQVDSEASFFRDNSVGNKFLSTFAKIHGYNYLRNLISPLIAFMRELPLGHSYEMDPNKARDQDIAENQKTVEYVASKFLNLMVSSLPQLPPMVREISAYISKRVAEIWPNSKFAFMGAFIFLRFITPAVVAPETVDIELPAENRLTMRRGLMVIGKILQNLANNIFFGKEVYMTVLNKFLEEQIANVTRFLSEIHKSPQAVLESEDHWQGIISDDTDAIVLHRFLDRHADKIGKELLSMSRAATDGDATALNGKRVWDDLCALLVDLGAPVAIPRLSSLNTHEYREYRDLMGRHSDQSTSSVEQYFIETEQSNQEYPIFVLRLAHIVVEAIDIELLMHYILKVLTGPLFATRSFDIIVDCTGFSAMSELPLQWLRFCVEIVPKDIRERFHNAYILNPNSVAQKYLRRLYNLLAGTSFCQSIKACVSVTQLLEDVPESIVGSLAEPYTLEQETYQEFSDVTWKQTSAIRVPVTLRVANTHIRITSCQRQPVSPALSCRNVEIIYLADIGDVYNIFTGQDMNEFIVRRRQGDTTYFSSPSRDIVVKTIRQAKGKLKDTRTLMTERFSRFSNVPATLLHVGLLSVDPDDEALRGAAYHLLGAVCAYLKYDKSPIVASQAGIVPADPMVFVNSLSEKLAEYAPQLTLDFIHEVSVSMKSMDKNAVGQRIACLHYLSPWIKNLAYFVNPTHTLYERSGARLRDCIRTLAELSIAFPEITTTLQKCIWAEVSKSDSSIVDAVLDELIRTASDGGITNPRCETVAHIIATISSIGVRGRVYHKLRKALNRPPAVLANNVSEHTNYNEISTLVKLSLVVGSQSRQITHHQLYVPEIIHLVMLVAADGPIQVRKSVYGIILNLLQSLYVSRAEDVPGTELLQIIKSFTSSETLQLFGLQQEVPTTKHIIYDPPSDRQFLDNLERLASFLAHILEVSSGSRGLLNIWRARWMSLVTSTAFQNISAIQTRSFIALSTLANQDVDDDFLYQILVAFRAALMQANAAHVNTVMSMLRCMCHIIPILQNNSRYICPIFWLAVCLLQFGYSPYYVEAATLLRVTLEAMENQGTFKEQSLSEFLLEQRVPLEEITLQVDDLFKLSFDSSFCFSLAAIIFKGMRLRAFKDHAESALRTLLRVTLLSRRDNADTENGFTEKPSSEVLGYFLALLPASTSSERYRELLRQCHIGDVWHADAGLPENDQQGYVPKISHRFLGINDSKTALLVATFVGTMLSTAQGDDAETEMFYSLMADLAIAYPDAVSLVFGNIEEKIINAFHSSSNPAILRYVSDIFRVVQPETPRFNNPSSVSTSTFDTIGENSGSPALLDALEEIQMSGLAHSFQFIPPNHPYVDKLLQWMPNLVDLMI